MTAFAKHLIVNGSLNPSLTLEELLNHFIANDWVQAAWSIAVELNVYHGDKDKISYDDIKASPKAKLLELWTKRKTTLRAKSAAENEAYFKEGRQMHTFLSSIRTPEPHILSFHPHQALGYLEECTAWNKFSPRKLQRVIEEIEALDIRADFGENNPNTGRKIVSWSNRRDYWMLKFKLGGETKNKIVNRYDRILREIFRQAEPDSVRVEEDQFEMTYVLWWD